MKSIKITEKSWAKIYSKLITEHPPSYIIIREKMKEKLGFVFRRHERWEKYINSYNGVEQNRHIEEFFLDFYDEKKKTWFLLKYGNYLTETETENDLL
jgi:hypothetical protein